MLGSDAILFLTSSIDPEMLSLAGVSISSAPKALIIFFFFLAHVFGHYNYHTVAFLNSGKSKTNSSIA